MLISTEPPAVPDACRPAQHLVDIQSHISHKSASVLVLLWSARLPGCFGETSLALHTTTVLSGTNNHSSSSNWSAACCHPCGHARTCTLASCKHPCPNMYYAGLQGKLCKLPSGHVSCSSSTPGVGRKVSQQPPSHSPCCKMERLTAQPCKLPPLTFASHY
jgi:hypothetical protein